MSRQQHDLIFGHLILAEDTITNTSDTHYLVMWCHIPE